MRKQKKLRFLVVLVLVFAGLSAGQASAASYSELFFQPPKDSHYQLMEGVTVSDTSALDLWHYSAGYWKAGNKGSEKITITDDEMKKGVAQVIPANPAEFRIPLPASVKGKLGKGKKVTPLIRAGSDAGLDKLFVKSSMQFRMDDTTLYFSAVPRFNIIRQADLSFVEPYGINIPATVPFIERQFGYNMYSVFGNGANAVQVNGWVNPEAYLSTEGMPIGWIHPTMIAGTSGRLKPGYRLMVASQLKQSDGYTIGQDTFANAGACGLHFEFPVTFVFYAYKEILPELPPVPEKILCQNCHRCELPVAGVCTADTCKNFDTEACGCYLPPEVNAKVELSLPRTTYETHPVLAVDNSRYTVDGRDYSATRAYGENLASNTFAVIGESGSLSRIPGSNTKAQVAFPTKGDYHVRLRITPKGGSSLTDIQPITVLKTPTVLAVLGGTQKQNRKQTLSIKVATNADNPLTELWVELTHKESGEKVRLIHHLDGGENTLETTDLIKTRALIGQPSDLYFTNCRLEFLTKNQQATDFTYRVYARDQRGLWDEVSTAFSVAPDQPPRAAIDVAPSFVRDSGSNVATLKTKDATTTDGDQVKRHWSVANAKGYNGISDLFSSPGAIDPFGGASYVPATQKPGYQDLSLGSKTSIQFSRTGVGKIGLRLEVREVWTEETLPEYITEADYLTGEAFAVTRVVNVAPKVRLEPITPRSGEFLLLAGSQGEYDRLKEAIPFLQTALLEEGVDGTFLLEKMSPKLSEQTTYEAKGTAIAAYGHQGTWQDFWEQDSWAVDNHALYKAEATWPILPRELPQLPYTLRAYDAQNPELPLLWSMKITGGMLLPGSQPRYLAQDSEEQYLYFVCSKQTLLLDKKTGALLGNLPYVMGRNNSVSGNFVYTYQPDGIYRVSMVNGAVKKLYHGNLTSDIVRRLGGEDHFLITNGNRLSRGVFDPKSEQLHLEQLEVPPTDRRNSVYRLAGIDTEGKLLLSYADLSQLYSLKIRVYSRENHLIKEVEGSMRGMLQNQGLVPVVNQEGAMNHIGFFSNRNTQDYKYCTGTLWGIESDYRGEVTYRDRNGYPSEINRPILGIEHENGNCYLLSGGERTFIASTGSYSDGPTHGLPERAKAYEFLTATTKDGARETPLENGVFSGLSEQMEWAKKSDAFLSISTGENHENRELAFHQTTLVSFGQSADDLLSRSLQRNLTGKADLNAVILYDESNGGTAQNPKRLADLLREKNASFLYTTNHPETKYAEEIAAALGKKGLAIEGGTNYDAHLAKALLRKETASSGVLQIKTTAKSGGISHTYAMDADTPYFYEYEYKAMARNHLPKNILDVEGVLEHTVVESELTTNRYSVTETQLEDFNDLELNSFFAFPKERVKNGLYEGAHALYDGRNNRFAGDGSTLTFTVPEGKQALFSFDYESLRDMPSEWMSTGVWIGDGEWDLTTEGIPELRIQKQTLWEEWIGDYEKKGTYTHKHLLQPGLHTLTCFSSGYGNPLDVRLFLDNLCVDFVEQGKEIPGLEETFALTEKANGWHQVRGSVVSPKQVSAYTELPSEYYNGAWGKHPHTSLEVQEGHRNTASLGIPEGKIAIYVGIDTVAAPARNQPIRYTFQSAGPTLRWNNSSGDSSSCNPLTNLPSEYRFPIRNLTGWASMEQRISAYRGSYGNLPNVEFSIVDKTNPLTEQGRYFLGAKADGSKGVFLANDNFVNRANLSFVPGEIGDYQLRNFRLYRIQNGVKVYVEDTTFTESATLQKWQPTQANVAMLSDVEKEPEDSKKLIYQKGELVAYHLHYFDYEKDPGKKQYWRYTHTPFNDGAHPEAAVILDENGKVLSLTGKVKPVPISRFYIDGKYVVEHWQEDNTTRGIQGAGNPDYDKESNVERLTFYILGGGAAPWVTQIQTLPKTVKEGSAYRLQIGIDDGEKEPLSLTTELYQEGKLIYTHRKTGITAENGKYKNVVTEVVPKLAEAGKFQVVCTVRDRSGAGIGSYPFLVVSDGKITGQVRHTDQWEANRKTFNQSQCGKTANVQMTLREYLGSNAPKPRGSNVFWAGEQLLLRAEVKGNPSSVVAKVDLYQTSLLNTGEKNAKGDSIYKGTIWSKDMRRRWGKEPSEQSVTFTASYKNGETKTDKTLIIVDNDIEYWLLHRYK